MAAVKIDAEHSSFISIEHSVCQGRVLSLDFLNIQHLEGIRIDGKNINNLRYPDDTVLIATCEKDLQKAPDEVVKESEVKGLNLNVKKTIHGLIKAEECTCSR